jgi:hypothetical protein
MEVTIDMLQACTDLHQQAIWVRTVVYEEGKPTNMSQLARITNQGDDSIQHQAWACSNMHLQATRSAQQSTETTPRRLSWSIKGAAFQASSISLS